MKDFSFAFSSLVLLTSVLAVLWCPRRKMPTALSWFEERLEDWLETYGHPLLSIYFPVCRPCLFCLFCYSYTLISSHSFYTTISCLFGCCPLFSFSVRSSPPTPLNTLFSFLLGFWSGSKGSVTELKEKINFYYLWLQAVGILVVLKGLPSTFNKDMQVGILLFVNIINTQSYFLCCRHLSSSSGRTSFIHSFIHSVIHLHTPFITVYSWRLLLELSLLCFDGDAFHDCLWLEYSSVLFLSLPLPLLLFVATTGG